jgi:hypothetical protein
MVRGVGNVRPDSLSRSALGANKSDGPGRSSWGHRCWGAGLLALLVLLVLLLAGQAGLLGRVETFTVYAGQVRCPTTHWGRRQAAPPTRCGHRGASRVEVGGPVREESVATWRPSSAGDPSGLESAPPSGSCAAGVLLRGRLNPVTVIEAVSATRCHRLQANMARTDWRQDGCKKSTYDG